MRALLLCTFSINKPEGVSVSVPIELPHDDITERLDDVQ